MAQLATFSEGLLEYHQQCTEILRTLTETLLEKYVQENSVGYKFQLINCMILQLYLYLQLQERRSGKQTKNGIRAEDIGRFTRRCITYIGCYERWELLSPW